MISIGSRGDVEPFLAVGQLMQEYGHEVYCAVPEQFKFEVEKSGLIFRSLGPEFMEIIRDQDGQRIMSNGGPNWRRWVSMFRQFRKHIKNGKIMLQQQDAIVQDTRPDHILHSGLSFFPFIWEQSNKGKTTLILPVPYIIYPEANHAHVLFNVNWGPTLNKLSYAITNWNLSWMMRKAAQIVEINFDWKKFQRELLSYPTLYTVSPALIPQSNYPTARVVGFMERKQSTEGEPPIELQRFLDIHEKILLITFGSMTSGDPLHHSTIFVQILEKHQIPAIIVTASGGLTKPDHYDSRLIFFMESVPFDWILPKMYGVVHHGGSGTTHSGLRHGCSTLIIPHIFDQFMWNKTIARKKLGPKGIKISKISGKTLEPRILDLYHNPIYKSNALSISRQMKNETDVDEVHRIISRRNTIA